MKHFKFLFICICFCSVLSAQIDSVYTGLPAAKDSTQKKKENEKWEAIKQKITYGGNFQVWFGNPTFVYLSPTVGYLLTEKLNVGVGLVYNYMNSYGYTQSVFGGHSFIRYGITDGIFVQLQYDKLRQNDFISAYPDTKKVWVDYLMAGGGFRQPLGDHVALTTALMYNLTPSVLSIYYPNRLLLQFGITAGF